MSRTLTEKKVLKKLGIPDFRHMTKEKVVSFVSMLPQMNPEVAKAALAQFPEYAQTVLAITEALKATVSDALADNTANMESFNTACLSLLESLQKELEQGEPSLEDRSRITDTMVQVLALMSQKDTENKHFLMNVLKGVFAFGAFAVMAIGAAIGANAFVTRND